RMQDARVGVKDLRVARLDQVPSQELVLRIGDVPEWNVLPDLAGETTVHAGKEGEPPRLGSIGGETLRRAIEGLDVDLLAPTPVGKVAFHLGLQHVACIRPRVM